MKVNFTNTVYFVKKLVSVWTDELKVKKGGILTHPFFS